MRLLKIPEAPLADIKPALQLFEIVARAAVPAREDEPVAHECLPFEPVTDVTLWEENNLCDSYSATLELVCEILRTAVGRLHETRKARCPASGALLADLGVG